MNPSNPPPPSPSPEQPQTDVPRRPQGWMPISRILVTFLILMGLYAAFSLLNFHSIAQWKWAAALDAVERREFEHALAYAQQAIDWAPEDPQLRVYFAELLYRLDETAEARIQIEEAIALGKDDPQILEMLGYLLARMNQHDGALMLANRVVESAETNGTVQLHRALNHRAYSIALAVADEAIALQRVQEGLQDIEQAIEIYGENPSYLDTRGYLRMFDGDLQGALDDMDAAIVAIENQRKDLLIQFDVKSAENLPANAAGVDKHMQNILAVLYAHRGEIYARLGKKDLAEKERQRADRFGLDRKKGVW